MKRVEISKPYLSVCMIVRNAESPLVTMPDGTKLPALEACLQSVRARAPQAEIVIVHTGGSTDRTEEIALKYADVYEVTKGPRGEWDAQMYAIDDAAWARQRSFDLAHGRWRGWIDHDDRWPDAEETERLLRVNDRWKPDEHKVVEGPKLDGKSFRGDLEDVLEFVEQSLPLVDAVWCPYLYQRDPQGIALAWQSRERFVLWDVEHPKYHWKEPAHEVLVPVPGHVPGRLDLPHLLYVHEKDFSSSVIEYNLRRHFQINLALYEKGDTSARRAGYLAAGAMLCAPEREMEFRKLAHDASNTPLDRFRALIGLGGALGARGLWSDALEAFGAATHVRPDLPDAWLSGAERWLQNGDFARAIEWFKRGIVLPFNAIEGGIQPRDLKIKYPALLTRALDGFAKGLISTGHHQMALDALTEARKLWQEMLASGTVGDDGREIECRLAKAHNEEMAQKIAMTLAEIHQYLRDNDEPLKATKLLAAAPWTMQDHPLVAELERLDAPVLKHASGDDAVYFEFYSRAEHSGFVPSPESWLDPEKCLTRAHWLAGEINRTMPNARVLDIGCYDGIIGIPLLKLCPGIRYLGVEGFEEAAKACNQRITEHGLRDRAEVVNAKRYTDVPTKSTFDVILFTEVIEHVADPQAELRRHVAPYLKDGGKLYITTPWGPYDHGCPNPKNSLGGDRDARGHLRVVTPRDLATWGDQEDLLIEEALHEGSSPSPVVPIGHWFYGQEHRAVMSRTRVPGEIVRFAVPGALWDWNSRTVHAQGMGASEETIVYLAKELAKTARVEVYGPTPDPDVHHRVRYWPRAQIRHAEWRRGGQDSPLVVSRGPAFGRYLRNAGAVPADWPMILWLQDVYYPDLTPETLACYRDVVVVSEWHKQHAHKTQGVPLEQLHTLYNFLLPEHFTGPGPERKRDRFVYASSPDRGINRVLELWPKIKAKLPDADLHIFYGWRGCEKLGATSNDASWNERYRKSRTAFERLSHQKDVFMHGMVNHADLATWFRSSGVWAYPSGDRQNGPFLESCCLTASKVRAAGCVPVCPPRAALAETAACSQGFFVDHEDEDDFVRCCVEASKVGEDDRRKMSQEAIETYSLSRFLGKWQALLKG